VSASTSIPPRGAAACGEDAAGGAGEAEAGGMAAQAARASRRTDASDGVCRWHRTHGSRTCAGFPADATNAHAPTIKKQLQQTASDQWLSNRSHSK
jgi:hypothetical protein